MEITAKQDYYTAMAQIEVLLQKGFDNLTQDEDSELNELSQAVEVWEIKTYPMPINPAIKDILNFIMHQRQLNRTLASVKNIQIVII
jgi:antitoxin component HigA of HigAB toxin-antitoxin module